MRVGEFGPDRVIGAPADPNDVRGVYRDLVPGQKLVFTWAFAGESVEDSLITITPRGI